MNDSGLRPAQRAAWRIIRQQDQELGLNCLGSGQVPSEAWTAPIRLAGGGTRPGTWGRCSTCRAELLLHDNSPALPDHHTPE